MTQLTQELSQQMLVFHRLYTEKIAKRLRAMHVEAISQAEFLAAAVVVESGGLSMGEICERTSISKQQMTHLINQLESKGMVQRSRAEHNRRQILVRPTDSARALMAEVRQTLQQEIGQIFGALDTDTLTEYLSAIRVINGILERFPSLR